MTIQDREHPRYAHEAAVTLYTGSRSIEGRTRNVSRGGACANLVEPVRVGIDIDVDIVLVFEDDATSEPLRIPARVVWCTQLDDAHQVGLVFRAMSKELHEYLTMFLRYLQDAKPERANAKIANVDDRFK